MAIALQLCAGTGRPSSAIAWALWSAALALPWLIGLHPDPWPNFYNEIVAAASVIVLGAMLAWQRQPLQIDGVVLVLVGMACIPLLQAAFRMFMLPSEAPVIALYLFGMACTVALGRTAQAHCPQVFATALFGGLAVAALISAVLGFAQMLHLDWGNFLAPVMVGSRPYANIGQPNELATLLVWGVIAVLWLRAQGRIANHAALPALIFLLAALLSTRSRTGWVAMVLLHAVGFVKPECLGLHFRRARWGLTASLLLFVLSIGAWELVARAQELAGTPANESRFTAGARPEIWRMAIDGILQHPWFGYGWDQGRLLQLAVLPAHCGYQRGFQHAHNFVLDLIVWNGIPLGILLVAGIVLWFVVQLRRLQGHSAWLMMLTILVFVVHALLELPHVKAFFLLPVALLVGALNASSGVRTLVSLKPVSLALLSMIFLVVGTIMVQDFLRIGEDLRAYRVRMAWAGIAAEPPEPDVYFLTALQSALRTLRVEPRENMDTDSVDWIRRVAQRYPIQTSLMLYAKTAALNGKPDEAVQALNWLCLLFSEPSCERAKLSWVQFQSEHVTANVSTFPAAFCRKN